MSNKLLNAIIALIEDRTSVARELLRSPELKMPIGDVQVRLEVALKKRETAAKIEALKDVLKASIRLEPDEHIIGDRRDALYTGVAEVEQIVENLINELSKT